MERVNTRVCIIFQTTSNLVIDNRYIIVVCIAIHIPRELPSAVPFRRGAGLSCEESGGGRGQLVALAVIIIIILTRRFIALAENIITLWRRQNQKPDKTFWEREEG